MLRKSEYKILQTETFEKTYRLLTKGEKERINRIKEQLKINPWVGKPLGYRFFREKKIDGFRIYYLIYEEYLIVYLITRSSKKLQQRTINYIKSHLKKFREEITKRRLKLMV